MVSRWKKSVASNPAAWARRNVRQWVSAARRGPDLRRGGCGGWCRRRMVSEAGELALDAAVSPGGFSAARRMTSSRSSCRGAAGPVRVGPFPGDQAAVPGQQRGRGDEPVAAQRGGRSRARADRRARSDQWAGWAELAAKHHDLVAQDQDLRVLGRLSAAQQDQPAEDPGHDQVQQTGRHEPRSCPNPPATAKSQVNGLCD